MTTRDGLLLRPTRRPAGSVIDDRLTTGRPGLGSWFDRKQQDFPVILLVLLTIVLIGISSISTHPTQDGPAHAVAGQAWLDHVTGASPTPAFDQVYEVKTSLFPAWAAFIALGVLEAPLGATAANFVVVIGLIAMFAAASWYLVGALDQRSLALAPMPLAVSYFLNMGFYNFVAGAALFMVLVGYLLRRPVLRAPDFAKLSLLLLALYFSHLLAMLGALGAFGLVMLVRVLSTDGRARWQQLFGSTVAVLPALALTVSFLTGPEDGELRWNGLKGYAVRAVRLGTFDYSIRSYNMLQAAVGLLIALGLLVVLWQAWRRRDIHSVSRVQLELLLVLAAQVLLFVVVPDAASAAGRIPHRYAYLIHIVGIVAILSLVRAETGRRVARWLGMASILIALLQIPALIDARGDASEIESVASVLEPDSIVVSANLYDERDATLGQRIRPALHAAVYPAFSGGRVDLRHTDAAYEHAPLEYRANADPYGSLSSDIHELIEPPVVLKVADYMRESGIGIDYVILIGRNRSTEFELENLALVEELETAGFERTWSSERSGLVEVFSAVE